MKKLLLCIYALFVMHIQATESAGAAGQVERKVEVAQAGGRQVNKEATDKLWDQLFNTDEGHPVDLEYVQELIAQGADVNVWRNINKLTKAFLLELAVVGYEYHSLNLYKHIIEAPGFDPIQLKGALKDIDRMLGHIMGRSPWLSGEERRSKQKALLNVRKLLLEYQKKFEDNAPKCESTGTIKGNQ